MLADPGDVETSAFEGLPAAAGIGRGVIATEREGLAIARIAAHRAQAARVSERCRAQLGLEPPNALRRAGIGEVGIAGIGPGTWLATHDNAGSAFVGSLRSLLGDCASVVDQSDAYAILRLAGPKVRETLAKLIPIDIHPRAFRVSDVAQTFCAYMKVTLWRFEDAPRGEPVFEIWAGRSFAVSLHRAICHSAAEFGFVREAAA
jgi:heterotetrameric sarcosine oxidase gamma subunit